MSIISNIKVATDELHKAFALLNQTFFDNELPEPAITIQTSGKRLAMGWCTTREIWHDKEGKIKKYELNISAEYLNIDFLETMDTIMHEMVHLYNLVNGIQDCSRGGTYHNKKFKAESERRGFYFPNPPHPVYGWSFSRLTDETKEIISKLGINEDAFKIARNKELLVTNEDNDEGKANGTKKGRRKSNSYKWICESCGLIVRSTKENVRIMCGDCRILLVQD